MKLASDHLYATVPHSSENIDGLVFVMKSVSSILMLWRGSFKGLRILCDAEFIGIGYFINIRIGMESNNVGTE